MQEVGCHCVQQLSGYLKEKGKTELLQITECGSFAFFKGISILFLDSSLQIVL